jgi:hypothetical protein
MNRSSAGRNEGTDRGVKGDKAISRLKRDDMRVPRAKARIRRLTLLN